LNIFFENPILFIIIIAVISSFFKKKKAEPHPKRNIPGAGHGQSRTESSFDDVKEIFREVTRKLSEEASIPPRKIQPEPVILEQETVARYDVKEEESKEYSPPPKLPVEAVKNKEMDINANQIVDSIIWAEILGPPRAKNPYGYKSVKR
jgi:hypothetical protein